MFFNMDDFDIESFIEEVETRPAIWNSNCCEYNDRQEKIKAWENLVAIFDPDFDDKTIAEKNLYGKQLQKKWKCLRDCYTREVNRRRNGNSGPSKRRPYLFYKNLNFLKPVISKMTMIAENNKKDIVKPYQHPDPLIIKAAIKRRKKLLLRQQAAGLSNKGNMQNKTTTCNTIIQQRKFANKQKQETGNEDRLFLLSLVKHFQKIPEDDKLDAKWAMIGVLKKYQSRKRQDSSGPQLDFPATSHNRSNHNQSQNICLKNNRFVTFPDERLSFSPLPELKIEQEDESLGDQVSPRESFSGLIVNNENSRDSEMYDLIPK